MYRNWAHIMFDTETHIIFGTETHIIFGTETHIIFGTETHHIWYRNTYHIWYRNTYHIWYRNTYHIWYINTSYLIQKHILYLVQKHKSIFIERPDKRYLFFQISWFNVDNIYIYFLFADWHTLFHLIVATLSVRITNCRVIWRTYTEENYSLVIILFDTHINIHDISA